MIERDFLDQYRQRIVVWLASVSGIIVLPFSVNNLIHQRWFVGTASLVVLAILTSNAVALKHERKPVLPIILLAPACIGFLITCFIRQGLIAAFWCYPTVVLFYFLLKPHQARVVNILILAIVVPVAGTLLPTEWATRFGATLAGVSVTSAIFVHLIHLQQQELRQMATLDPLTQVNNRLQLDLVLRAAQARYRRSQTPATLVALDIDHFKQINDRFGHAAGDLVLKQIATLLRTRLRATDTIFRTGGEEFLVLLELTPLGPAVEVAEQLRRRVADAQLLAEAPVTISLGVAQLEPDESLDTWIQRSDALLYHAKQTGRNRVAATPSSIALPCPN